MYLYCERIIYDNEKKSYEAILDFNSYSDLQILTELFDIQINLPTKTVLILSGLNFNKYMGFRSGYWYDIPLDFFTDFRIEDEYEENLRVLVEIKYVKEELLNILQYRTRENLDLDTPKDTLNFEESDAYIELSRSKYPRGNIELIVRNVGCGNWNEIKAKNFWLIYDLGGDIKFTSAQMNKIFKGISFNQKFFGVISHWDLDHYRAILDLNAVDLKKMKFIIAPSKMPATLQLSATLKRLKVLKIPVHIVSPSIRVGRTIDLVSRGKVNNIEIFRSCDGSNINQSGIVLTIEGNKKIAVLTGDHSYPQLYKNVFSKSIFFHSKTKPFELVVPHHGGDAGTLNTTNWNKILFSSGALSTLSGRYSNVPNSVVHNFFVTGKNFHCTDCIRTDYTSTL